MLETYHDTYDDKRLILTWVSFGQHLKVKGPDGVLLINTRTNFVSEKISARQVKWILEHYEAKKKTYAFV